MKYASLDTYILVAADEHKHTPDCLVYLHAFFCDDSDKDVLQADIFPVFLVCDLDPVMSGLSSVSWCSEERYFTIQYP